MSADSATHEPISVLHTGHMALLPDQLDGGDIELQRARPAMSDAIYVATIESFEQLHRWMIWANEVPTRAALAEFLNSAQTLFDRDEDWNYALIEKSTGDVVGSAGLHFKEDPESREIGYWVRSDRTRRGYATSAAGALSEAAFRFLPIDRVTIRMDKANVASASVPPRIGFRLLGEEDRPLVTPGHTGTGLIWVRDRESA
jgi:RimJ/RimL family protein N-acetyltransferase